MTDLLFSLLGGVVLIGVVFVLLHRFSRLNAKATGLLLMLLVPPDRIPINARILGSINMPSENYFKTMEAKLHILDGCGLSHYRMIYESIPTSR
ncbi:MAG TPA: hypothetical protein EYP40_03335, partial [Chromatiales bacterium]|nr:hypothetical protein [Chromatiales bacterium]